MKNVEVGTIEMVYARDFMEYSVDRAVWLITSLIELPLLAQSVSVGMSDVTFSGEIPSNQSLWWSFNDSMLDDWCRSII